MAGCARAVGASPSPTQGLRLAEGFIDASACEAALRVVCAALCEGRAGRLPAGTYAPPPPALARRLQGREQLCFGARVHSNRVDARAVAPLPQALAELAEKLSREGLLPGVPLACSANLYSPGNWLPPHVDSRAFARPFAVVSLGPAPARVAFGAALKHDGAGGVTDGSEGAAFAELSLAPRSALVVDGAAADEWRHAVLPCPGARVSLVFRSLDEERCGRAPAASQMSSPPVSPPTQRVVLVWHRRATLRELENALYANLDSVAMLVSAVILDDDDGTETRVDGLVEALNKRGGGLVVRRGVDPAEALAELAGRMTDTSQCICEVRFVEVAGEQAIAEAAKVCLALRSLPGGRVWPCGGGHGGGRTLWHDGGGGHAVLARLPDTLPPRPKWLSTKEPALLIEAALSGRSRGTAVG